MKNKVIILLLVLTAFYTNAQVYEKGDFLLNADVQVTKMSPSGEVSSNVWEGTPLHISAYYVFLNKHKISFSSGLHGSYFRHQPGNFENYGTLGIALPLNIHLNIIKNVDTYAGYRIGYYFDGYNPESNQAIGYYEGTYSEMYLGIKYFLLPRLGVFAEATTSELQLNAGISFKL